MSFFKKLVFFLNNPPNKLSPRPCWLPMELADSGTSPQVDFGLLQSTWWVAADAEVLESLSTSALNQEQSIPWATSNFKNKPLLHTQLMTLVKTFKMPHLRCSSNYLGAVTIRFFHSICALPLRSLFALVYGPYSHTGWTAQNTFLRPVLLWSRVKQTSQAYEQIPI